MLEEEAWLRLKCVPGLGNASILRLLQGLHSPEAILSASYAMLTPFVSASQAKNLLSQEEITEEVTRHLTWLQEPHHHLITLADEDYPKGLLELPDPPVMLFGKGERKYLTHYTLAMIGSRHPTEQGMQHAREFAKALSHMALSIISGLATGIDSASHEGALLGEGKTIAVVGTGLDIIYPASNRALAQAIVKDGLILSEFNLGVSPRPAHFPARNRLIAALSRGCIVVEAALKSGSLITARQALELGREVFAIPGSIHSPLSKGCHALIKSGAKLIESVEDILTELNLKFGSIAIQEPASLKKIVDPEQRQVFLQMGYDPISIDDLAFRMKSGVEKLSALLLVLEMEGKVVCLPDGRYQRCVE